MNDLKIFEGTQIDILQDGENFLFEIYSTGMALGHVVRNAKGDSFPNKTRIDASLKSADISTCLRGVNKYITEEQLYDLMLEMRTDKVKPFRKWVTSEVLPSIRKTGGYSVSTTLPNFSDPVAAARAWADSEEQKQIAIAEKQELALELGVTKTELNKELEWYTVARYNNEFSMHWKMAETQAIGKAMTKYCRAVEHEIRKCKTNDERFGDVNSYHIDSWRAFFKYYKGLKAAKEEAQGEV